MGIGHRVVECLLCCYQVTTGLAIYGLCSYAADEVSGDVHAAGLTRECIKTRVDCETDRQTD